MTQTPADKLRTMIIVAYGCFIGGILLPAIGIEIPFLALIALVIVFIKRKEAAGTMYESHCVWVLRTFVIGFVVSILAALIAQTGSAAAALLFIAVSVWAIYRLAKGALRLYEGKPVEMPKSWI